MEGLEGKKWPWRGEKDKEGKILNLLLPYQDMSFLICFVALLAATSFGAPTWSYYTLRTSAAHQELINTLPLDGWKLKSCTGVAQGNAAFYNSIWYNEPGAWRAVHGLTAAAYQTAFTDNANDGYTLVFIDAFGLGGISLYNAIWERKNPVPAYVGYHEVSSSTFQTLFDARTEEGFALDSVSVSLASPRAAHTYNGVFSKSGRTDAWLARIGVTSAEYQSQFNEFSGDGFVLHHASVAQGNVYATLWIKSGRSSVAYHNFGTSLLASRIGQGNNLVPVALDALWDGSQFRWLLVMHRFPDEEPLALPTPVPNGPRFPETNCFDDVIVARMSENDIPGASLAIMDQGRIVYEQAYGTAQWSDGIVPMQIQTPIRMASLSKPLTALVVLRLFDQGRLSSLDERIFDSGGLLQHLIDAVPSVPDSRWRQVTIRQLLHHRAGTRSTSPYDPMFFSAQIAEDLGVTAPVSCSQIITHQLQRALVSTPGSSYDYSNFGYCILGRVVEAVTQKNLLISYRELLDAAGIAPSEMYLGNTRMPDIPYAEAEYWCKDCGYAASVFPGDQSVLWPYGGFHLEAMDSHGAWVSTASAIMKMTKFASPPHCNGTGDFDSEKCLLSADTVAQLTLRPPGEASSQWYGLGWWIKPGVSWDHTGSLPGSLSIVERRDSGLAYSMLVNTRQDRNSINLKSIIEEAISCVSAWPPAPCQSQCFRSDLTGDGDVNLFDLLTVIDCWGNVCPLNRADGK